MSSRRNVIIGAACAAAGAAAFGLTPRRRVSLLGANKLDDIVPRAFGDWTSTDRNDEVAPREEGSLATRLYGQTVGRLYTNTRTGVEVMMLLAWGNTQSNDLQVHRPEVCYPAFGYDILSSEALRLPLSQTASLPLRRITVQRGDRVEQVVYWTRLGEFLPQSVREQRIDRFRTAVTGLVPDGLLARFSRAVASASAPEGPLKNFIPELLAAIPEAQRKVLIGSRLAKHLR
jgi:EpsI family protein